MKKLLFTLSLLNSVLLNAQNNMCDSCKVFYDKKDYKKNIDCINNAIKVIGLRDPCLLYSRAHANYDLANYNEAEKDILSITTNKDSSDEQKYFTGAAYFLLGNMKSDQGYFQEGLVYLFKALEYWVNEELILTIGYTYLKLDNYPESVKFSSKAIEMNDKDDRAYSNRAMANIKLEKLKEAEFDLMQAISLNPNNPFCYKHRGLLNLKNNKKKEACEDFQKANELGYKEFSDIISKNEVEDLIKSNCE